MSIEERVRDALRAEGARFEPSADLWERVERAVTHQRKVRGRRVRSLALVAAAVAASVVGAVAALDGDEQRLRVTDERPGVPATEPPDGADPDRASTTTVTIAPTTSPPARPAASNAMPAEIVAVTRDNRVVVLSAADGRLRRVLYADDTCPSCAVDEVVRSPDGHAVYFSVRGERGDRLVSVPTDGGAPRTIGTGCFPSVSPDGMQLAFVGGDSRCTGPLVVRDLSTGRERRFGRDGQRWDVDHSIGSSTWLDDSRTLVFSAALPEAAPELWRLDTRTAGGLVDARHLGPGRQLSDTGTGWSIPRLRAHDGLVGVVQRCCSRDANSYDGGTRLLVIDASTGDVRGEYEPAFSLSAIAYDNTGRHLLLVAADGAVYRRSGGDAPVRLGDDYSEVDW